MAHGVSVWEYVRVGEREFAILLSHVHTPVRPHNRERPDLSTGEGRRLVPVLTEMQKWSLHYKEKKI